MRQALCVGATLLASAVVVSAAATRTEVDRIHEAAAVLREIHQAPDKDIPMDLWENASCVAVIPSVKKAAFIVGGEYGRGLMTCRDGASWSAPSFLMLSKGSVGFQIGAQSVDLILLVMNEQGLDRLVESPVALGGEASVAAGPVGRDARALTDGRMKAQIVSYSRTQGVFAGIDLTGGVLKPDRDSNRHVYGRDVSPRDILVAKRVSAPKVAAPFLDAVKGTMPPKESARR